MKTFDMFDTADDIPAELVKYNQKFAGREQHPAFEKCLKLAGAYAITHARTHAL